MARTWATSRSWGEVADGCGLDRSELLGRLESRHYQHAVMSEFQAATALGITAIPAFLIGKYVFTGARPYEAFQSVVESVLTDRGGTADRES